MSFEYNCERCWWRYPFSCQVSLELTDDDSSRATWNHQFRFRYDITLRAKELELNVDIINKNEKDSLDFTFALHTYFKVDDISQVKIGNFKGLTLADKALNFKESIEDRDWITVNEFVDRVYKNSPDQCTLQGLSQGRQVQLFKARLCTYCEYLRKQVLIFLCRRTWTTLRSGILGKRTRPRWPIWLTTSISKWSASNLSRLAIPSHCLLVKASKLCTDLKSNDCNTLLCIFLLLFIPWKWNMRRNIYVLLCTWTETYRSWLIFLGWSRSRPMHFYQAKWSGFFFLFWECLAL